MILNNVKEESFWANTKQNCFNLFACCACLCKVYLCIHFLRPSWAETLIIFYLLLFLSLTQVFRCAPV